ncbi:MAG: ribonuclease III [Flavobacteriales bacterium]|jgi:ribonuclease-3|uniref:ribonuclease III family protein n=1 Tax=Blattabacterium sp. (Mastotermes darwiniensis) TaxID=39768 RepID=UPI000231DEFC|nr:ribonuclease III domain-containing protein [Blattabacterium sp. (Mastotermes darwiniensis)]AER40816.1 ribonuclease III [Blattabacterium sp. (Mastotermes darwiniensis) str. MADAR]MDR1804663.1 ribonuclease III [Flavobacteriales bacterium]
MLSDDFFFQNDEDSLFFKKLKNVLGFCPKNIKFFKEVFVYSFSTEKRNLNKNYYVNFQRLEFLGDAVLNSIISHFLYERLPKKKEGELTQVRSKIVCRKNLNDISKKLFITEIFFLNKPLVSDNILGNVLEALIGFIYLEIGYQECKNFVYKKILHHHVNITRLQKEIFSYKVWIIEWSQKNKFIINFNTFREKKEIKIEEEYPHVITYLSEVSISECGIKTEGRGPSKKKSEEFAAKQAYFLIQKQCKKYFT